MALTIEESFLPATLTAPPMTDEQFAAFCAGHPDLFFEMTAQGEIVVMPPNFTLTGIRNARLVTQLQNWADRDGRGVASDPSTGFVLPNGARRSPDAAWTSSERIARMEPASVETYWRLCPDFVVELRSQSDRLPVLRGKMREWIENGAQLAWLIDPDRRAVEVYRPGRAPEVLIDAEAVEGEGPVVGLRIEMRRIWNPLAA